MAFDPPNGRGRMNLHIMKIYHVKHQMVSNLRLHVNLIISFNFFTSYMTCSRDICFVTPKGYIISFLINFTYIKVIISFAFIFSLHEIL